MLSIMELFAIVLFGFTVLLISRISRHWILRQAGYILFFAVLLAGWLVAYVMHIVILLCTTVFDWELLTRIDFLSQADYLTVTSGVVLSLVIAGIANCFISKKAAAKTVSSASGDLIEWPLQDAMDRKYLVELSMENGKTYIGCPVDSGITTSEQSDISLVPLFSGYRRE